MAYGNGHQAETEVTDLTGQFGDKSIPDGPERIKEVFKYVIKKFREKEVNNVTWFMYTAGAMHDDDPDNQNLNYMHPKYAYPGDDYIDWVGKSFYIHDSKDFSKDDRNNVIDSAIYQAVNPWKEVTTKPIFLTEFGFWRDGDYPASEMIKTSLERIKLNPQIGAITIADSPEWKSCCGNLILGGENGEFKGEIDTWKKIMEDNYFKTSVSY